VASNALFRAGEARIGAFDPAAWAGLVFCPGPGRGFGLRLAVEKDGRRASTEDLFWLVHEVGPHAPDGGYARVAFDLDLPFGRGPDTPVLPRAGRSPGLAFEWSRALGEDRVVGRVSAGFSGAIELDLYFPWDWRGSWRYTNGVALGREESGAFGLAVVATAAAAPAVRESAEGLTLRFEATPGSVLLLSAALGTPPQHAEPKARRHANPDEIASHLAAAAARHESRRAAVEGAFGDAAAAVTNSVHWMVALEPESARRCVSAEAGRAITGTGEGRDEAALLESNAFLGALALAVESPELAREAVLAALAGQGAHGSHRRDRPAGAPDCLLPSIGAFAVLKLFERSGDRSLLREAFPALERWSERRPTGRQDGPGGREAHGIPEADTHDIESVDLSVLLALDDECLSLIAAILGDGERSRFLAERADRARRLLEQRLWCEGLGLHLRNLLPLLAGIPSPERAETLARAARDPRLWSGAQAPLAHYLVVQGLRRYGFDAEAAEFAARGARPFLHDSGARRLSRDSPDGRASASSGQRHGNRSPLQALLALEELIDATPFEGLRLGTLRAAEARARRVVIRGREWDVAVSPRGLLVRCDGWTALRSDAPVVLRHVELDGGRLAADAHALAPVRLRPGFAAACAVLDGRPAPLDGDALVLPPGRHRFEVQGVPAPQIAASKPTP
jgi:hypothetical protein